MTDDYTDAAALFDVDAEPRHFDGICPGLLERVAGVNLRCSFCGETFLNAYRPLSRRTIAAAGLTPDERAVLNALEQHLTRERAAREVRRARELTATARAKRDDRDLFRANNPAVGGTE